MTPATNKYIWSISFFTGSALFLMYELNDTSHSVMGWFLATSLWSALCGIGYSLMDWLLSQK